MIKIEYHIFLLNAVDAYVHQFVSLFTCGCLPEDGIFVFRIFLTLNNFKNLGGAGEAQ